MSNRIICPWRTKGQLGLGLSIEELHDGTLVFKNPDGFLEYIVEYSRRLIGENEFFGAFGRVHSLIEFMMQNRYEMDARLRKGLIPEEQEIEMTTGEPKIYRWRELIEKLREAELINHDEAKRIKNFGCMRDRIMHRLMKYSFQSRQHYRVVKEDAVKLFEEGVQLADLFRVSKRSLGTEDKY